MKKSEWKEWQADVDFLLHFTEGMDGEYTRDPCDKIPRRGGGRGRHYWKPSLPEALRLLKMARNMRVKP
jgi:hypothetical protein